jgi:hypothetical protein
MASNTKQTDYRRAGQAHLRVELTPWDDREFVRQFELARERLVDEGLLINGPRAAARLEQLLHATGYPAATVDVERTVDEALHRAARWTVRRDGRRVGPAATSS